MPSRAVKSVTISLPAEMLEELDRLCKREHRSRCRCQSQTAGAAMNRRNVQAESERDKYHVLFYQHEEAGPAQRPACPPRKNGCEGGQQYGCGECIRVKVEQIRKLERRV